MRTRTSFVVAGRPDVTRLAALGQDLHGLLSSCYQFFSDALHIHSLASILTQLQVSIGLVEQVDDLFVVDLQEGASNDEMYAVLPLPVDAFKKKLQGPRNQSALLVIMVILEVDTHHRVGLTGTSLSVCKDGAVIT